MLTHIGTQRIETERLILRKFNSTDADSVFKNWASDELVQSWYSEPIYETKEKTSELLNTYINSYEKEDYYRWAITLKDTNECIGQIAIFLVDNKNHFCEYEYCIGREFQKNGYATEATKAIIDFSFNKINFNKVQICHKSGNPKSQSVIEKCGLTYEGALRDYFYMNGKYVDRHYYSVLKSEWCN
ncbi:MAG: GNAT family protein [Clostridium sp.]